MAETQPVLNLSAGKIGEAERVAALREILGKIESTPDVAAARAERDAATSTHDALKRRYRELGDGIESARRAMETARAAFIEAACTGKLPGDASKVATAATLHRELGNSYTELCTIRLPRAHFAALTSAATFLEALAGGLETAAGERLAALIESLAPALAAEGGLGIDPKRTLAGQLTEQAASLRVQAAGLREDADKIMRKLEQRPVAAQN